MRCVTLLASLMLAGCASQPDTPAPVVLREMQRIEVPVPVKRVPPADLMTDYRPEIPEVLGYCQGDYSLTRQGVEQLIDAMREARDRLSRWRAWAQ